MGQQVANPFTLQAPYLDILVTKEGRGSDIFQQYLTNLDRTIQSMASVSVAQFGARGDDNSSDSVAFNNAVITAVKLGGGNVEIPSGTFLLDAPVFKSVGDTPIRFVGKGRSSVVKLRGNLPNGAGMFDLSGSNVFFDNFVIDGGKTDPTGLQYGVDFNGIGGNDPMADSLTRNTSVWIHGGTSGFSFKNMLFMHAAGYSILADALLGDISDIEILNNLFKNNRPTLFGSVAGMLNYGSWNGGIFLKGDGRTAIAGIVKNVQVAGNRWSRNTGNNMWMHSYGFARLNSDVRVENNSFEDSGLDGVLMGALTGGIVSGNVFRRIGYVTRTDTDRPVPKWLANKWAVGVDSSGLVKGVDYVGNSFTSINGGCIDADGHGMSVIGGNICRIPFSDEPEFEEDSIAICGPAETGATSYGLNTGNTSDTPYGGQFINITGNTLINMRVGSLRLYAARNCLVQANNIIAPDDSIYPPIPLGPGGAGANQGCTGNVIKHNRASYSPGSPAPLVFEDPTVAPFSGTDVNQVFGNCPIIGNGLATEFQKDPSSGSPTWLETPWFS